MQSKLAKGIQMANETLSSFISKTAQGISKLAEEINTLDRIESRTASSHRERLSSILKSTDESAKLRLLSEKSKDFGRTSKILEEIKAEINYLNDAASLNQFLKNLHLENTGEVSRMSLMELLKKSGQINEDKIKDFLRKD